MKKLMSLLLGLSLALGCVSVAFGDDAPKKESKAKKSKGAKKGKKADETKKAA